MPTQEFTGKTVEEATASAAKALGVSEDQLKVSVLEKSKGLFGKGNVRISVETAGAETAEAKPAKGKASKAPKPEKPEKPAKEAKPAKASKAAKEEPAEEAAPAEESTKAVRGRGRSAKSEEPEAEKAVPAEEVEVVATQEDADRILATVQNVVASGGFEIKAHVSSMNGRYVNVELDGQGKELGYLVGKNGEVLNALQYLMNIISSHQAKNGVRLTLDANNYRQRREVALSKYAEEIANEVNKRKEEAVLDPLPAFERRIIHKALSAIKGITTYSEGEEPNRRVVIAPVD